MKILSLRNNLLLLLFPLLVSCNTTGIMAVSKVPPAHVDPVTIPLSQQSSFVLQKVVANIKRGTIIGHFPASGNMDAVGVDGFLCNDSHSGKSTMEWGAGSSVLGNWSTELGEIFYEVLNTNGFNVAGDPRDLFGQSRSVSSAEYLVGASITKISSNFCQVHHWWDGRPLDEYSGEMFVDVDWTVFSTLTQREVMKVETSGYYKQVEPKKDTVILTFHNAFAGAVESFIASNEFRKVALKEDSATSMLQGFQGNALPLSLPVVSADSIESKLNTVLAAVVTVRSGMGHGSGFIINEDGYILTNAHVVNESSKAAIILNNGLEVIGDVIRVSEQRDVALIKVPLRISAPLPIRKKQAELLEKIYVIGSPLREGLQSSVTAGIVSAHRNSSDSATSYIQSDAATSPGNSGGPLLDQNGNVMGISVAKVTGKAAEGINLFIPILSALDALKIIPQQE
ncbi:S1C family serine protease [Sneathiella sp.]|uniref:S1C family serine protease n=1 Tax=Sneathiella sp. TaxID=1964365 RepID=UPI002FE1240F